MRFILRCMFWLSFVYASILTDTGGRTTAGRDIAETARAAIAAPVNAVAGQAAARLSAYCRRDPGGCLADSVRLNALVATTADDMSGRDEAAPAARRPEPRHRARGAVQARMP